MFSFWAALTPPHGKSLVFASSLEWKSLDTFYNTKIANQGHAGRRTQFTVDLEWEKLTLG